MSAYDEGAHIELERCRRALHRVTAERDKLREALVEIEREARAALWGIPQQGDAPEGDAP